MDVYSIDIRHLAALEAVAEEASFGRAAERLGYTQSAISQQIAGLEKIVEGTLFDRPGGPKRVRLTPLGEVVLDHARAVLARLGALESEVDLHKAGRVGHISVGTFQSVSVQLLPTVFQSLRAERPDLTIRLIENDEQDQLARRLVERTLDAAFLVEPIDRDRFDVVRMFEDQFVLLSPSGSDLAPGSDVLSARRLRGVPLISQFDAAHIKSVDDALRRLGIAPNIVFRSADNAAVQAMVRAGLGHAVMPSLAADPSDPGVELRRLDPGLPSRIIALVSLKGRTQPPALARFVELAGLAADELVGRVDPITGLTR